MIVRTFHSTMRPRTKRTGDAHSIVHSRRSLLLLRTTLICGLPMIPPTPLWKLPTPPFSPLFYFFRRIVIERKTKHLQPKFSVVSAITQHPAHIQLSRQLLLQQHRVCIRVAHKWDGRRVSGLYIPVPDIPRIDRGSKMGRSVL